MSSGSINDLPDSAFAYIEPGGKKDDQGKTVPRSLRHFPIHDAAHVRNALARAPQSPFGDKAMPKIRAAAKKFGIKVTENRADLDAAVDDETPRAPIEFRDSNVAGVNFAQRLIEVVAVPYEESALVEYRGELWNEMFLRGSFDGIEKRPNRVRANRDHDDKRLVGKVARFYPSREEGLVAEVRVSYTPLGDETLELAKDDVLDVSVGFAARGKDQEFDRRTMTRRIRKAFADHIAFTPTPAYAGAGVLAVRHALQSPDAAQLKKLDTPNLDELRDWLNTRKQ
jgi:HK97 family phage prohead protease